MPSSPSMTAPNMIPMEDTIQQAHIKKNKSTQSARFPSIRKILTARYKINGSNIPAKTAFPCQSRIKRNKPLVRSLYAAKT